MAQENKVMTPQEWFDKHGPKGEDSITASELASSYAKYYHSEMSKGITLCAMISVMQEYSVISEESVVQYHEEWLAEYKQNKEKND